MPKYASARKFDCSAVDHQVGAQMIAVYLSPNMCRALVRWFIREEEKSSSWKTLELSLRERKQCHVPDGAIVVTLPEAQEETFIREYDSYCRRLEARTAVRVPSLMTSSAAIG